MTEMNHIHQIIAKYFAGEISEEEMGQLRGWLESSAENQKLFDDLKQGWEGLTLQTSSEEKSRVLNKVKGRIKVEQADERPVRRLFGANWYRVAASVLIAVSVGSLAWNQISEPFSWMNTIGYEVRECDAGKQTDFLLADGSHIYMNGDSRMKFKSDLEGTERNVYMEGEAFFDVARDESKPFVIDLDGAEVKVLGTSFNVKAYPEDDRMETSVITGKVAFTHSHKGEEEGFHLVPGQKGVINHNEESMDRFQVDNQLDIAWMKRGLLFVNTPLSELTKTLYRTYGVKFKLTDGSLKDLKITASFENEKLEEIMKILEMTNEFSYKIEKDRVVIGNKNEF